MGENLFGAPRAQALVLRRLCLYQLRAAPRSAAPRAGTVP
ncbi:hypothetical protein A2U01_0100859, partial [Trifolium medium]|nr:hypothetical protein [Trifolium medium]